MNLLWALSFGIFFGNVATQHSYVNEENEMRNYRDNLKNINDILSNSINTLGKFINTILWFSTKNNSRPFPVDVLSDSSVIFPDTISPICRKHFSFAIQNLFTSVKERRNPLSDWSMQMFDSLAKPPSGIFKGNMFWLGNFWECIAVEVGSEYSLSKQEEQDLSSTEIYFKGEYCLIQIEVNQTAKMRVGVCLPNSCTLDDKSHLIAHWIGKTSKVNEQSCYTNQRREMDATAIIIICCLVGIVLFFICGSIVDNKKYSGRLGEFFSVISLHNNFKKVFNLEKRNGDIHVLHGIRVFSMSWIILGHCYMSLLLNPPDNLIDVLHAIDNEVMFGIVLNTTLAVDTFFLISSTLIAYNFLKKAQHFKLRSLPKMYLLHYIRLTPAFMVTVAIIAGPLYYLARGPLWEYVYDWKTNCRNNWWIDILYIFNSECSGVAWYIGVDIQLFIVTSLLLYPLYRKPKWGLIGIGICIILSLAVQMLVIYFMHIGFIINSSTPYQILDDYTKYYYLKPWGHSTQYMVGLILGYFLHAHFNKKKITIKPALSITAWIMCTVSSLTLLLGTSLYYSGQLTVTPTFNVLFGSLSKLAWTINIAWIILACTIGSGGIVERILSWKYFIPISKISYSCYLIQGIVLMVYFCTQTQPIHFDHFRMANAFISILVTVLFFGFLLCVLFEMPINSLSIFLMTTKNKTTKQFPENDDCDHLLKQDNI